MTFHLIGGPLDGVTVDDSGPLEIEAYFAPVKNPDGSETAAVYKRSFSEIDNGIEFHFVGTKDTFP